LLFILFLYIPLTEGTEPSGVEWHKNHGGAGFDSGTDIIQTTEGGFAILGYTYSFSSQGSDYWLLKTNSRGNLTWSRVFTGDEEDQAYGLIQTDDGYVLVGHTRETTRQDADFLLLKTDNEGMEQYHNKYGSEVGNDYATDLVKTSDNGVVISGFSDSFGSGNYDFVLMKTTGHDSISWSKNYDNNGIEKAHGVIKTKDEGFALIGTTKTQDSDYNDIWLVKTDSNGDMQWNKTYGGDYDDNGYSLVQTDDGGYTIAGETSSYGAGGYDAWLIRTDENGNMMWNRTFGGKDDETGQSIIKTSDNGFAIGGSSTSMLSNCFYMVKTNSQGYKQWSNSYPGKSDLFAFSMTATKDEGYALAGIIQNLKGTNLYTMKIKNASAETFDKLYPIADAGEDITINKDEEIIFQSQGSDIDGYITKYQWDYDGDGIWDGSSNKSEETRYSYSKNGFYKAYLEVTDDDGYTDVDMRQITVSSVDTQVSSGGISRSTWMSIFLLIAIFVIAGFYYLHIKKGIGKSIISKIKNIGFLKRFSKWTWNLLTIFFIMVILKFIISLLFQTPKIFFDELSYASIAHDISQGNLLAIGELHSSIHLTHAYPAGYSYFIAPAYIFGNNVSAVYHGMLLINAVLTSLIIFPVFFIMKEFVPKNLALTTSAIVACLPTILTHTYLVMSENVFYLLFILSVFFLFKTFTHDKFDKKFVFYSFLTGLTAVILLFIKATGIVILPALLGVFIYKIIIHRRLSSLKYGLMLIPSLITVVYLLYSGGSQPLGYNISKYLTRFQSIFTSGELFNNFFNVMLKEFSYFVLMSYIVFLVFTIFLLFYWRKLEIRNKGPLFMLFLYSLLSLIFLMGVTADHLILGGYDLYSRYISPVLPMIFMFGIIGIWIYQQNRNRKADCLVAGIFIFLLLFYILLPIIGKLNPVNNIDLVWISYVAKNSWFILLILGVPFISFFVLKYLLRNFYYFGPAKTKNKKKKSSISSKEPFNHMHVMLTCVIVLSIVLSLPTFSLLATKDSYIADQGLIEPASWLTENHPDAVISIEDSSSSFSGAGMNIYDWHYMHASMFFWYPSGKINVIEKDELIEQLSSKNISSNFLLSTHDLTDYYPKIKDFYMDFPAIPPRKNDKVDWHIYKIN